MPPQEEDDRPDREQDEQEQEERPRRRRRNDDDDDSDYRRDAVKGGIATFNKRPIETMLAVIVVGVGVQMFFNYRQQASRESSTDARYDKMVAERSAEREHHEKILEAQRDHDSTEREKDREAAEKRLQEVLAANRENFQRVVDHLKFLSDSVAKISNQQQAINFGYDRNKAFQDWLQSRNKDDSESKPTAAAVNDKEDDDATLHAPGVREPPG